MNLTPAQHKNLMQALAPLNTNYDASEQMLGSPFSSPGYHTTLTGGRVHSTRDSLQYAAALMDTADPVLMKRAEDILRRVVALQDTKPNSKTYGIWSWFLEEPLDKMSPPDWNWADFCGVPLLQVVLYHRSQLPPDLATGIDTAIKHAAASIRRRNVGPGYTNIAVMGTYVTLVAAETYHDADLKAYAMERLRTFHDYSVQNGGFTEYNSSTYTITALKELGRLRLHAQDPAAKQLIDHVYRMAWEEIAQHFHAPTCQWAGPQSRSYGDLMNPNTLALIERSTDHRVNFGAGDTRHDIDEHRLPTPMPPDLEHYFSRLDAPRNLVKTFVRDPKAPVVGTTYLSPAFALGTINRGDLWNQRRPLLAYWGSKEKPSYLRLRFLHDDYDFTAARFWGRQNEGRVLAAINIATDGGDRHPSLDPIKNATIRAKDLRVRFEIGGEAAASAALPTAFPADPAAPIRLSLPGVTVGICVSYARMGNLSGHWEAGRDAKTKTAFLDLVFYSGNAQDFNLNAMKQAAIGLVLQLSTGDAPLPAVASAPPNNDRLKMEWAGLTLDVPVRPAPAAALTDNVR